MNGVVFYETLRRSWRQIIYWGLGFMLYAVYPFVMVPDQSGLEEYADLVESMDSSLLSAFGIESAASLSTPEGFIGYSYFGFLLVVFAVFAVIAGLNVTANEEDAGIMDMVLSLPVPRWRLVVEKLAAYATMVIAISLMGFVGLLIGNSVSTLEVGISTTRYLEGALNLIPGMLLILSFTAFVGTLVRRKSLAAAIAGGFVIISYLTDAVGRAAGSDAADTVRELSVFAHYDGTTVLQTGLVMGSVVALLIAAFFLAGGAIILFQRRDIAV